MMLIVQAEHGNWPKKSNAVAIEIVTKKRNAIVLMHYFCEKSNAIIEILAQEYQ